MFADRYYDCIIPSSMPNKHRKTAATWFEMIGKRLEKCRKSEGEKIIDLNYILNGI